MMRNITLTIALILISCTTWATTYTWTGAVSTAFGTAGNWSPAGTHSITDNYVVVDAANDPVLSGNVTVNALTVTSGVLTLGGYDITVNGKLEITGGTVTGGAIIHRYTSNGSKVENVTMSSKIDHEGNGLTMTNVTTSGTVKVKKTGGQQQDWGGNVFTGPVILENTHSNSLRLGVSGRDSLTSGLDATGKGIYIAHGAYHNTIVGTVLIKANGGMQLATANGAELEVHGDIRIRKTGSNTLRLGDTLGVVTHVSGVIENLDTINGNVVLRHIEQGMAAAGVNMTTTGGLLTFRECVLGSTVVTGVDVTLNSNQFNGRVAVTAGSLDVTYNEFNGVAELTKTGTTTHNYNRGNAFLSDLTLALENGATKNFIFGNNTKDSVMGNLSLLNTSSCRLVVGNNTDIALYGDLATYLNTPDTGLIRIGQSTAGWKMVMKGIGDQHYRDTSLQTVNMQRLQVDKPSGRLILDNDMTLFNELTLTKGTVEAQHGTLVLRNNATVTGASDLSYVEGKVLKIGDDAFTFPVGRNGAYRPIAISAPSSTTAEFRAEYKNLDPSSDYDVAQKDGTLGGVSTNEYWLLDRVASTNTVSVTLKWAGMSCAIDTLSKVRVAAWDGTKWKDKGNGGTTGNTTSGTVVTSSASSTYGAFTLASTTALSCVPCRADAGEDRVIYAGWKVRVGQESELGYDYSWTPNYNIDNSTFSNPLINPEYELDYHLETTNTNGCVANDYVHIQVIQPIQMNHRCIIID